MTLKPGATPLPITGAQYFAAEPPGFVWRGRVRMAPGLWIDARDRIVAGEGRMTVKAESTVTIADVRGPQLDQGALVRLLGEMTWFPSALVVPRYVSWDAIDDVTARAHLQVAGRHVSAVFRFGPNGLPTVFEAERYRDLGGGKAVFTLFSGAFRRWRVINGFTVPFEVESTWQIDGQPFSFARFSVEAIEFDMEKPFD